MAGEARWQDCELAGQHCVHRQEAEDRQEVELGYKHKDWPNWPIFSNEVLPKGTKTSQKFTSWDHAFKLMNL